ncbi:MAG: acyl carrier protein [Acutalibacteraceae bacterium]|jgi:acyl carrier protein|nr:acyl carrier protein [Oscillospiraceae bacterium]HCX47296.1 acyl carrier protein [Oscillospiraceae bacterium]
MSTFERVQKIICEQLEIDSHLVTEDASISGDLGADSLDLVDLSMSIEEEFNLEVPDDVLDHIRTVGDIVKFIDDNE